jgi:hypothetical protein
MIISYKENRTKSQSPIKKKKKTMSNDEIKKK